MSAARRGRCQYLMRDHADVIKLAKLPGPACPAGAVADPPAPGTDKFKMVQIYVKRSSLATLRAAEGGEEGGGGEEEGAAAGAVLVNMYESGACNALAVPSPEVGRELAWNLSQVRRGGWGGRLRAWRDARRDEGQQGEAAARSVA